MNGLGRGGYDFTSDLDSGIMLVRWNDNNIVTVATNFDSVQPLGSTNRYSKDEKEKVPFPVPKAIKNYSSFMGGGDLHDWLASKYCIKIRGKKWYWPLFTRIIDMAIVNAWIFHKHTCENPLPLLDFRRTIAVTYLKAGSVRQPIGQPSITPRSQQTAPFDDTRFDRKDHLLHTRDKRRRCQMKNCPSKPLTFCKKCNVTLCKRCFGPYHSK